jgi:hypothetical protein
MTLAISTPLYQRKDQEAPVFSRVAAWEKREYESFFEKTSRLDRYAEGESLTDLVYLAERVEDVTDKCNPILDTYNNQTAEWARTISGRQWQLDRIGEVKKRLALAIVQKRRYYENTAWGQITKFFLEMFGMWNKGNTAAIVAAEDFLLRWDSRGALARSDGEKYEYGNCIFFTDHSYTNSNWVRNNLNTLHFYNYNPTRTVTIKGVYNLFPPNFVKV